MKIVQIQLLLVVLHSSTSSTIGTSSTSSTRIPDSSSSVHVTKSESGIIDPLVSKRPENNSEYKKIKQNPFSGKSNKKTDYHHFLTQMKIHPDHETFGAGSSQPDDLPQFASIFPNLHQFP